MVVAHYDIEIFYDQGDYALCEAKVKIILGWVIKIIQEPSNLLSTMGMTIEENETIARDH